MPRRWGETAFRREVGGLECGSSEMQVIYSLGAAIKGVSAGFRKSLISIVVGLDSDRGVFVE